MCIRDRSCRLCAVRSFYRTGANFRSHLAISILYPHRKFWRSSHGTNFPRNFKRPKNAEDASDLGDFWTKRIAALSAKFWKKIGPSENFREVEKFEKLSWKVRKILARTRFLGGIKIEMFACLDVRKNVWTPSWFSMQGIMSTHRWCSVWKNERSKAISVGS